MKSKFITVLALSAVMLTAVFCSGSFGAEDEIPVSGVSMAVNAQAAEGFKNSSAKAGTESEEEASEPKKRTGWETCRDHDGNYHFFAKELVDYIGEDKFGKWRAESNAESEYVLEGDCSFSKVNIVACLDYFKVPREDFERLYYENNYFYKHQYDPDVLYCGDEEKIQAYFRPVVNSERLSEAEYRSMLGICKSKLAREAADYTSDEAVVEKYTVNPYSTWTLEEYIRETGIALEDFAKVLEPYPKLRQVIRPEEVFKRAGKKPPEGDLAEKCGKVMLDEMRVYNDNKVREHGICIFHAEGYHAFDSRLMDYIGNDRFHEWNTYMNRIGDTDLTDRCRFSGSNIMSCIEYFGITREEFAAVLDEEYCEIRGYDLDVMFGGDEEAIEKLFAGK